MERPVGIDDGRALEIGPENDFGIGGSEKTLLRAIAEAVIINRGRELLDT